MAQIAFPGDIGFYCGSGKNAIVGVAFLNWQVRRIDLAVLDEYPAQSDQAKDYGANLAQLIGCRVLVVDLLQGRSPEREGDLARILELLDLDGSLKRISAASAFLRSEGVEKAISF